MKEKYTFFRITVVSLAVILAVAGNTGCKKSSDSTPTTHSSAGIKDYDGNVYDSVRIGTQVWLVQNLKTTHYRNGDPLVSGGKSFNGMATDTSGAYLNYGNSDSIVKIYGRLYNFWAGTDPRGIAPLGFHVPSDAEWSVLEAFLGNDTLTGGKLKESGTLHWKNPNLFATNSSGFTAIPAGSWASAIGFVGLGYWNSLWTSTSTSTWYADARGLTNTQGTIGGANLGDGCKLNFFSIRCVMDPKK
jgi:uncharacterized protein (TIGR02145 family)